MSESANRETFFRYFQYLDGGDEDRLRSLLTEDVTFWLPPSTAGVFPRPIRGVADVVALALSAEDYYERGSMRWDHLAVIAEGDYVAGNEILRAVKVSGEAYENMYSHWFRYVGGRVAEIWEHVDTGAGLNTPRRRD
jgi:ketosteroid isomerase-like protein